MSSLSSPDNTAAAAADSPAGSTSASLSASASARSRMKNPGVRIMGTRIYDSTNGKTCHQCRQKTMDFAASCTNLKKGDKLCTIKFCHKCLLNRYGEKAEEVEALGSWICPKCRGICNCSFCMKKKGQQPTGRLVHTAKAEGCSSVLEYLDHRGPEGLNSGNALVHAKGVGAYNHRQDTEETIHVYEDDSKMKELSEKETETGVDFENTEILPQGTPLMEVAGTEFFVEDVGPALQFLEFCGAFSEVLCIKRGQPESILQEVAGKCPVLQPCSSLIMQFHIRLLSLIRKDRGESVPVSYSMSSGTSWLQAFGRCITESECPFIETPPDFFNMDSSEYFKLDPTTKLRLLNFLCDETLTTGDLRSWIEQENTKFYERKKELKGKVLAAKRKVKDLKQKLKVELVKPMLSSHEGAPPSISEHNVVSSEIRTELVKAQGEFLESTDLLLKKKQRADAVRTEPLFLDGSGNAYWKLGSSCSGCSILHQDIGKSDLVTPQDKWFFLDEEKEKLVEKHISSLRNERPRKKRKFRTISVDDASEGVQGSSKKSTPPNCLTEGT